MKSAPNRALAKVIDQDDKGDAQAFGFAPEMFKPVINIGSVNINAQTVMVGTRLKHYEHSTARVDIIIPEEKTKSCWDRFCRK